jgi:predicted ester cyclase
MTDPISTIRSFIFDYQSTGNEDVAERLLAPDFVDHTPFPGFGPTREDVIQLFRVLRAAFPNLHAEVLEQFADGDRVVTRKNFHGTHRGPFAGHEPTGRSITIRVVDIVRIEGGTMREHWNVVDVAGLMAQLGS